MMVLGLYLLRNNYVTDCQCVLFSAGLVGDDIFNWEVIIIGPPETLYEGKKYYM